MRGNFGSRSPPPFGASPPAFGFRAWIGRWFFFGLILNRRVSIIELAGSPPLELYWMGGFPPPWNFIGWAGSPPPWNFIGWAGFHYRFGDFPFGLYWMGGFPLTNWGFPPSDFIGLVSPSDFIRSGFLRIFIRLGEDDG
ncbi:unnamed protein product [Rhizophagus irregularis]|nr:unnamed protein product [Rhizophagus irregularis]